MMNMMLQEAFKEWAVICQALADGRQALILRKGGIAEAGGRFEVEHTRFWLFPTYTHQQRQGIKPSAAAMLDEVEKARPAAGIVRLSHFAQVEGVYDVHDVVGVLQIASLHLWSEETVRARFAYRRPGLYVLPVRVYRAREVYELPDIPAYAGCRSWVTLESPLPTEGATPVLDDAAFRELLRTLDIVLNPTAFA
jgi:hypothetical protein